MTVLLVPKSPGVDSGGTVNWIHPCHTAAILSGETKRALFYHAKPRNGNHGDEA